MCEVVGVVFAGKVEAVDLAVVPPLVECWGGLVVFQALQDGAIDYHLETQGHMHTIKDTYIQYGLNNGQCRIQIIWPYSKRSGVVGNWYSLC